MHPEAALAVSRRAKRGLQLGQLALQILAIVFHQVFDDGAGLGNGFASICDHWRLAQRMHRLEFGRRQARFGVALIELDLIGQVEFFQQPENALGARGFEVVYGDHVCP